MPIAVGRGRSEMEDTLIAQHHDIRRQGGSIDSDFYRQQGLTERRMVMTGFQQIFKKIHRGVVFVLILGAVLYIAPARDGTGWNDASIGTPHNGAMLKPLATSAQLYALRMGAGRATTQANVAAH